MTGQAEQMGPSGEAGGGFGRVAEDGTVYVRVGDREQAVGQYPAGSAEEALAFYANRYDALAFEVQLLEQRVHARKMSTKDARKAIGKLHAQISDPHVVGDLAALSARLDALSPLLALHKDQDRAEEARAAVEAVAAKTALVDKAERIAVGKDWRGGANQLRDLLIEWKALPRLDKATDDALWHRFSSARTTYTKARRTHFADREEQRGAAKATKLRLVKEAEELSKSTEWGPTSTSYRTLMQRWKSAGPAPRADEDALWARFRAAQDAFFSARDAANAQRDKELGENAEKKQALLLEAEALDPKDLDSARRALRGIAERWEATGQVPQSRRSELESRMRRVEASVRKIEDERWHSSDPEKSARADDMVGQLEAAVARLEDQLARAVAAGEEKQVRELEDELSGRRAFLDAARRTAREFSR